MTETSQTQSRLSSLRALQERCLKNAGMAPEEAAKKYGLTLAKAEQSPTLSSAKRRPVEVDGNPSSAQYDTRPEDGSQGAKPRLKRPRKRAKRRREKRDLRLEFLDKCRARGQAGANPVPLSTRAYKLAAMVMRDDSGRAALRVLCELPRRVAWAALRAARGGRKRRALHHWVARLRIAQTAFLWAQRVTVRRRGFAAITRGIGLGAVAQAAKNPNGLPYSRSALTATTHHGSEFSADDCGHLRALARCGTFAMWQPARDLPGLREADRGPSGYAYNQYWWPAAWDRDPPEAREAFGVPCPDGWTDGDDGDGDGALKTPWPPPD